MKTPKLFWQLSSRTLDQHLSWMDGRLGYGRGTRHNWHRRRERPRRRYGRLDRLCLFSRVRGEHSVDVMCQCMLTVRAAAGCADADTILSTTWKFHRLLCPAVWFRRASVIVRTYEQHRSRRGVYRSCRRRIRHDRNWSGHRHRREGGYRYGDRRVLSVEIQAANEQTTCVSAGRHTRFNTICRCWTEADRCALLRIVCAAFQTKFQGHHSSWDV
jgi:hypothetical protein